MYDTPKKPSYLLKKGLDQYIVEGCVCVCVCVYKYTYQVNKWLMNIIVKQNFLLASGKVVKKVLIFCSSTV